MLISGRGVGVAFDTIQESNESNSEKLWLSDVLTKVYIYIYF